MTETYRVTGVAVVVTIGRVDPAPVGVKDHRALLLRAAIRRTLLPAQRRVVLFLLRPSLLGAGNCQKRREKECAAIHILNWKII